jgi:hypothetical protein
LVPRPDVAAREIDDGAVLVNIGLGRLLRAEPNWVRDLEGAGIRGDGGGHLPGARRAVLGREVLAVDVRGLVEALVGAGLVTVAGE